MLCGGRLAWRNSASKIIFDLPIRYQYNTRKKEPSKNGSFFAILYD